jgi:phage-related protein
MVSIASVEEKFTNIENKLGTTIPEIATLLSLIRNDRFGRSRDCHSFIDVRAGWVGLAMTGWVNPYPKNG